MRKLLAAAGLVALAGFGVCRLLPERFAVNPPLGAVIGGGNELPAQDVFASRIRVPEGFHIGVWAADLPDARMLRFTPAGDLLVSQPRSGQVTLLYRDADGDGRPDGREVLLSGLDRPHGLALHEGWLYVAETDGVLRVRLDADARRVEGTPQPVVTGLPAGGRHWTRTIGFGPDGKLYVTVGSSCNVCEEESPLRASMLRFEPDGSGMEIYATGLRNAVGFDWRPATGTLYATDNGRDLLGDDFPPCELDRIERGAFYGWPYANGDRVPDPDLGAGHAQRIAESVPPAHAFRAHTAPLGITFLRGAGLPPPYRGAALVALHGSWNRTRKQGYEVVSLHWGGRDTITERPFVTGFEVDEDVIGRPVDVAEGPDGAIYVSDDYAGAVYRVSWGDEPATAGNPRRETRAAAASDPLAAFSPDERRARSARGADLWQKLWCGQCHEGERAREGVVVVPLRNLSARYRVEDLEGFLAAPTPPMPAYELSDGDRRDLAVYLLGAHP